MKKIDIGKLILNKMKIKMKNITLFFLIIFSGFTIQAQTKYNKTGIASFYADKFEGRQTANGEIYYHVKRTAAHQTLPFGSIVKVTNLENNKYVVVRINDRGPFVDNRIIDLSKSAAKELDFIEKGLAKVRVELIASTDDLPDNKPTAKKDVSQSIYYKVNTEKVQPKGKGVQIGSFKSDENVFKLVNEIRNKYKEELFVEVSEVKKQKVYRIIVGTSNNDEYLNNLKKKLSKEYPDCFIVTFKN